MIELRDAPSDASLFCAAVQHSSSSLMLSCIIVND